MGGRGLPVADVVFYCFLTVIFLLFSSYGNPAESLHVAGRGGGGGEWCGEVGAFSPFSGQFDVPFSFLFPSFFTINSTLYAGDFAVLILDTHKYLNV